MASLDTKISKRVLRHRQSRKYFRDGQWTRHLEEATDFRNIREVVETCIQHEVREIDLVLRLGAGRVEIAVRVK